MCSNVQNVSLQASSFGITFLACLQKNHQLLGIYSAIATLI